MIRRLILKCLLLVGAAGCSYHDHDGHRRHHDRGHDFHRYERHRGHHRDYVYRDRHYGHYRHHDRGYRRGWH